MIEIQQMQANHMYLIEGTSSANSAFFEDEGDCKDFLRLADKYLGDYLTVNSFQNKKDGWAMIITTKSARVIRRAYKDRRAKSKKCKKGFEHHEVWRMLSDQVRIWQSTFVKLSNQKTGRTGGKVSAKYRRYVFESKEEAEEMRRNLSKRSYNQAQPIKRYRASKKLFRMKKKVVKRSIYLSCGLLNLKKNVVKLGLNCLDLSAFVDDVLRHLIDNTLNHHFPLLSPKLPPT